MYEWFKRYRATKKNVILLEQAMNALGYGWEKLNARQDYKTYKNHRWHYMFHNDVNLKMQELENEAK